MGTNRDVYFLFPPQTAESVRKFPSVFSLVFYILKKNYFSRIYVYVCLFKNFVLCSECLTEYVSLMERDVSTHSVAAGYILVSGTGRY